MSLIRQLDQGLHPDTQARLALAVLVSSWLFGGATRFDVLAPTVPLLFGLGVVAIILAAPGRQPLSLLEKLCWLGIFAVPLISLIPLPPSLWMRLPVHAYPAEVLGAVGEAPWLPISLTPARTLSSAVAFVPAFATYLCVRELPARQTNRLLGWLVVFALLSVVLGLVQLSGGSGSKLRFYSITNRDAAVGFFSNANHFGTFIALTIPIATYLSFRFEAPATLRDPRALLIVAGGLVALLVAGALASMSRAGMGAAALALLFSTALVLWRLPLRPRARLISAGVSLLLVAGAGGAFLVSGRFAELAELDRVGTDGRMALWPTFARMAEAAMPFGTGLGSFDPTYRAYEVYTKLGANYLNNAHNDLAQVVIETGLPGIAMLALWASLIVVAFKRAWEEPERLERDPELGRHKLLVLGFGIIVLLGHSLVDYPLRGACVSATFALLLAQVVAAGRPPSRAGRASE